MSLTRSLMAATALFAAIPALAQTMAPAATDDAKHAAVDAVEAPQTAALNAKIDTNIAANKAADGAINAANDAQYAADRDAYLAAIRQHNRDVVATDDTFIRQQNAYVMAMADWRAQVRACKAGRQRACDLPTPDPMNYM